MNLSFDAILRHLGDTGDTGDKATTHARTGFTPGDTMGDTRATPESMRCNSRPLLRPVAPA